MADIQLWILASGVQVCSESVFETAAEQSFPDIL